MSVTSAEQRGVMTLWRRFRSHILAVLLLSLGVWLVHELALPIRAGRDMGTYASYYQNLLRVYPSLPLVQLFRTPVTPVFFGVLFDTFGFGGVRIALCVSYAVSLCLVFLVGASFRLWVGYLAWALVALDLNHYEWSNNVGSESPQSTLIVLWLAFAFFTFFSTKKRVWMFHAALVFLLVMNRPGNQVAALALLVPLLNGTAGWLRRFQLAGLAVATYLVLIGGYCGYNHARYGDFTVARLGDAHLPFYRVYVQDRLVRPANGPASAELGELYAQHLATNETLRTYEIDQETFFASPTPRLFSLIVQTVNDVYGWEHRFPLLRRAGIEACWAHPWQFWLGYVDQVREVFYVRGPLRLRPRSDIDVPFEPVREKRYARYQEKNLVLPSEGELIPPLPTGSFLTTKPRDYPRSEATVLGIRHVAAKWALPAAAPQRRVQGLYAWLQSARMPWLALLILLGLIGLAVETFSGSAFRDSRIPVLFGVQVVNLLASLMASVQYEFRYPFDPVFILFGCNGIKALIERGARTPPAGVC